METKEMYLCLEDCVFEDGSKPFTAGEIYTLSGVTDLANETTLINNSGQRHAIGVWRNRFKPVQTFARDGFAWIVHEGDECPVPEGWRVSALRENGTIKSPFKADSYSNAWKNGRFIAYRIISTGEQDYSTKSGDEDEEELPLAAEDSAFETPIEEARRHSSDLLRIARGLCFDDKRSISQNYNVSDAVDVTVNLLRRDSLLQRAITGRSPEVCGSADYRPPSPQEAAFAAKQEQLRQDEAKQTLAAYKPLTIPELPEVNYFPAHVGGKWGGA